MEQHPPDQNKNEGLFPKNQIYTIVGVIIVLAAIIFFVTRGGENQKDKNQANNDQNHEQVAGENNTNQDQNESGSPASDKVSGSGNITAAGTLQNSDDPSKGNLMVDSNHGKIYISTRRNFDTLIGKEVTLEAEGSLSKFTFLGFANTNLDVGGAPDEDEAPQAVETNVTFRGKLDKSTSSRGNYTITQGSTVVYFQTARDYSDWVGSDVTLKASGTLNSFTNGRLTK